MVQRLENHLHQWKIKYDRNWCQRMIWTSFKKCNSSLAHSPLPPKYRQSLHTSSTRSLQYYIYYKLREANQTSSYFGALFTACICGTTTARLHIQFILYICCLFIYCAMTIKSLNTIRAISFLYQSKLYKLRTERNTGSRYRCKLHLL